MSTLRRERTQNARKFLQQCGIKTINHKRTRLELEKLFQLLLNKYALITKREPERVFKNLSLHLWNLERGSRFEPARAFQGIDQDAIKEVLEGSLCYCECHKAQPESSSQDSDIRNNLHRNPMSPTDNSQD